MTEPDLNLRREIRGYVCLLLDGTIKQDDFDRLQMLLENNPAAQDYYLDLLEVSLSLRRLDWTMELQPAGSEVLDQELWSQLAYTENNAPPLERRLHASDTGQTPPIVVTAPRRVSRLSIVSIFTSLAAMLLLFFYANLPYGADRQAVAVLSDSIDAAWGSAYDAPETGEQFLADGNVHTLLSGVVKIESLLGPQLIIEGPSLFEFPDMNKVLLHSGRICVNVPKNAIGYSVLAPSFTVIDLGTEFGVSVDADGSGDVLMFSGKASLVAGTQGQTSGSHMLTEGSAKRVFAIGGQVQDISFTPNTFVRQMDSEQGLVWRGQPFNLADVVGGGNGFGSGRIGFGIEPLKGQLGPYSLPETTTTPGNGFVAVDWNPFVNGIFVPDGGSGRVQVATGGQTFDECPDTDGVFWTMALNGGRIADYVNSPIVPLMLDGRQCGTSEHPAIFLHTNLGITFDLQAVRDAAPGIDIAAFRSQCGISSTGPGRLPCADFWVLIDGQMRFSRRGVGASETHTISIPIQPSDRFLTLVATDGGTRISLSDDSGIYPIDSDWCLFAEPYLELIANH